MFFIKVISGGAVVSLSCSWLRSADESSCSQQPRVDEGVEGSPPQRIPGCYHPLATARSPQSLRLRGCFLHCKIQSVPLNYIHNILWIDLQDIAGL